LGKRKEVVTLSKGEKKEARTPGRADKKKKALDGEEGRQKKWTKGGGKLANEKIVSVWGRGARGKGLGVGGYPNN